MKYLVNSPFQFIYIALKMMNVVQKACEKPRQAVQD